MGKLQRLVGVVPIRRLLRLQQRFQADFCEIYTDVDGIYSTDPRIVKNARKLKEISYDEMLELANLGAAVLHPRAVEYAKHYKVPSGRSFELYS